jgi:hypothetical protein
MVTSTDKRPPPLATGERTGNKVSDGSGNMIAYIIAAIVVAFAGYYLYTTYYSPTSMTSTITDGTATKPSAPVAATPPAATSTTTPTIVPAKPPVTTTP